MFVVPYPKDATAKEKAKCIFKWYKSLRIQYDDFSEKDKKLLKLFYGDILSE
jgi:hypothetical protein